MRREASGTGARWAVASLDHAAALAGWAAVPEAAAEGGGWRRLYLKDGGLPTLSAVGTESGEWLSLGVEAPVPRGHPRKRTSAGRVTTRWSPAW